MTTSLKDFSAAAVLGTSIHFMVMRLGTNGYIELWRQSKRSGDLRGNIRLDDAKLRDVLVNLPQFANYVPFQRWNQPYVNMVNLPYEAALAILVELQRAGYDIPNGLMKEQTQVFANGTMPLDYQAAYARYLQEADTFLLKVQAAGFADLSKSKGIRKVTAPRRALALTSAAKGVYVYPDPHNDRYVSIDLYTLSDATHLGIRDIAFEHFEPLGLRPSVARR